MKQVFRRVIDPKGKIQVKDVAAPVTDDYSVLVGVHRSLISSGTERATLSKTPIELTKLVLSDPWMRKAVFAMLSGSLSATANKVKDELTLPREIGYSGAGVVLETGRHVSGVKSGDRVAYAFAGHANVVKTPQTLTVKIPNEVSFEEACFSTVGAIALNGVRKSGARLGHTVAVIGLGLIGQLTCQILRAAGCRVIGIDINESKFEAARASGVVACVTSSEAQNVVSDLTGGQGADCVIICAQTQDPGPANLALNICRKQGQVTFVGIVKMALERMPFFKGELNLNFSRAYGPGIMDPAFERGEAEYPSEYVRFTAQDNMRGFLDLIATQSVDVRRFISGSYPIEQAQDAYNEIFSGKTSALAIVLEYPEVTSLKKQRRITSSPTQVPSSGNGIIQLGLIGAGNFTRGVHVPNMLKHPQCKIRSVVTNSGGTAAHVAKQAGAQYHTTNAEEVLNDPEIDLIYIGTRHNTHAGYATEALKAKKHVFCEKPIALTEDELESVLEAQRASGTILTVGYNRRYAPLSRLLKEKLRDAPVVMHYTINTGRIPPDHWTLDPVVGGGRLLAEADHFFDLMNFYANGEPIEVFANALIRENETPQSQINFMVLVSYSDGSIGHLLYTDQGGAKYPRERVEIFQNSTTFQIDDFSRLITHGKRRRVKKIRPDMGHREELDHILRAIAGSPPPHFVGVREVERATRCTQAALKSIMTKQPCAIQK